jgi:hypothetical protein
MKAVDSQAKQRRALGSLDEAFDGARVSAPSGDQTTKTPTTLPLIGTRSSLENSSGASRLSRQIPQHLNKSSANTSLQTAPLSSQSKFRSTKDSMIPLPQRKANILRFKLQTVVTQDLPHLNIITEVRSFRSISLYRCAVRRSQL